MWVLQLFLTCRSTRSPDEFEKQADCQGRNPAPSCQGAVMGKAPGRGAVAGAQADRAVILKEMWLRKGFKGGEEYY